MSCINPWVRIIRIKIQHTWRAPVGENYSSIFAVYNQVDSKWSICTPCIFHFSRWLLPPSLLPISVLKSQQSVFQLSDLINSHTRIQLVNWSPETQKQWGGEWTSHPFPPPPLVLPKCPRVLTFHGIEMLAPRGNSTFCSVLVERTEMSCRRAAKLFKVPV